MIKIRRGATIKQNAKRFFLSPFFSKAKTRKPITCII